jgi:hypothetical protein
VCATGYLAITEIDHKPIEEGIPYEAPAAPVADRGPVHAVAAAPIPASSDAKEEGDQTSIETEQATPVAMQTSPARPPVHLSGRPSAKNPVTATESLSVTPSAARSAAVASEPAPGPLNESDRAPQAPRAADQPEPVVPDRLLMLRAAIANCAREGFFTRFACDQRARSQYCDGNWGDVPECPKGDRAVFGR